MRALSILNILITYLTVYSQIETDRPAFTENANAVSHRTLLFESGIHFYNDRRELANPRIRTQSYYQEKIVEAPRLLFRYGIADNAEFRFHLPSIYSLDMVTPNRRSDQIRLSYYQFGAGLKMEFVNLDKFQLSPMFQFFGSEDTDETFKGIVNLDLLWRLQPVEKVFIAGAIGTQLDEGEFIYSSVAGGLILSDWFIAQAEYVPIITRENGNVSIPIYTTNFSLQVTTDDKTKIDFTIGKYFTSLYPNEVISNHTNSTVQIGLCRAIKYYEE